MVEINTRRKTSELEDRLLPAYLVQTLAMFFYLYSTDRLLLCLHMVVFISKWRKYCSSPQGLIQKFNYLIFAKYLQYLIILNVIYYTHVSLCIYVCMCMGVCVFECSQDVCGHMSMGVHVYVCTYIHVFVEA